MIKKEKIYYINGKWIRNNEAKISIDNPGFQYGLGAFETIRFNNKKIYFLDNHLNRLIHNLKQLTIKKIKKTDILPLLNQMIELNNIKAGLLKVIVTPESINHDNWNYQNCSVYIMSATFF